MANATERERRQLAHLRIAWAWGTLLGRKLGDIVRSSAEPDQVYLLEISVQEMEYLRDLLTYGTGYIGGRIEVLTRRPPIMQWVPFTARLRRKEEA